MSLTTILPRNHGHSALRIYLSTLVLVCVLLVLARVGFWLYITPALAESPLKDVLKGFYIGFRFDARLAAILTLPVGLFLTLPGQGLARHRLLWLIFYFIALTAVWSVYALDFGFYQYLGIRLDATLFELTEDMSVGASMVWESYPLIRILAGLAVLGIITALLVRGSACRPVIPLKRTGFKALTWLIGFIVFFLAAWGQVSTNYFPLRWSQAYFSPDKAVTALALNPVQNLYDTYRSTKDDGYNEEEARKYYPIMADFLQVQQPDAQKLNYARFYPAKPLPTGVKRPNVVIIFAESMGYVKSSFAPGNDDPTPFLKAFARESVFVPHFFANTRTTARAIYTTVTGIPDVTGSSTGSRNPFVIDQRVVGDQFTGYNRYYMLGGNTNWANIRGIIANNIRDIKIIEEGFWKAPNQDVWGVSDYDMLHEANDIFKNHDPNIPFLAMIQMASFHKPFTVPDNVPGFEKKTLSEESRVNYGFVGEDEYNSMRFADFSLQTFFELAKKEDYYKDTIFFIFGDHGIKDDNSNMDASYNASDLGPWHVPMILHYAKLAPRQIDFPASQVDVFPTAAALAQLPYTDWTMGRDILDPRFDASRAVYVGGNKSTDIRLVRDGYCYFDNRHGVAALYKLGENPAKDYSAEEPERFKAMQDLAYAIDWTARYMLYNNKKPHSPAK